MTSNFESGTNTEENNPIPTVITASTSTPAPTSAPISGPSSVMHYVKQMEPPRLNNLTKKEIIQFTQDYEKYKKSLVNIGGAVLPIKTPINQSALSTFQKFNLQPRGADYGAISDQMLSDAFENYLTSDKFSYHSISKVISEV